MRSNARSRHSAPGLARATARSFPARNTGCPHVAPLRRCALVVFVAALINVTKRRACCGNRNGDGVMVSGVSRDIDGVW